MDHEFLQYMQMMHADNGSVNPFDTTEANPPAPISRPAPPRTAPSPFETPASLAGPSPHEGQYDENATQGQGLRLDTDKWNLLYGDPSQRAGYFVGGVGQEGAKWATADGGFTGTVNGQGLDSHAGLGGDMSLHAGADFGKQTGAMSLMNGSTNLGEAYGQMGPGNAYEAGLRGSYNAGGLQLDPSLARIPDATKLGLGVGPMSLGYTHGDDGSQSFSTGASQTNGGTTVNYNHTSSLAAGAQNAMSGFTLGMANKMGNGEVGGHVGVQEGPNGDTTSYGVNGNVMATPQLRLNGSFDGSTGPAGTSSALGAGLDYNRSGLSLGMAGNATYGADGHDVLSASLREGYGTPTFAQHLNMSASHDSLSGDKVDASTSATLGLGGGFYGSAFGSVGGAVGGDPSYFGGAGLTYMPTPQLGLTAAGGAGDQGPEARLQADFYKHAITGADSLEDQRAKALFSGYLGLSSGGPSRMSNVFGAGSLEEQLNKTNDPTVTLGVKVPF